MSFTHADFIRPYNVTIGLTYVLYNFKSTMGIVVQKPSLYFQMLATVRFSQFSAINIKRNLWFLAKNIDVKWEELITRSFSTTRKSSFRNTASELVLYSLISKYDLITFLRSVVYVNQGKGSKTESCG